MRYSSLTLLLLSFIVILSWDASPSSGVTGYKIYSGLKVPFKMIKDVGDVLTTKLFIGKRQCFAVTAYNAKGDESVYSNIVCEKIGSILWSNSRFKGNSKFKNPGTGASQVRIRNEIRKKILDGTDNSSSSVLP